MQTSEKELKLSEVTDDSLRHMLMNEKNTDKILAWINVTIAIINFIIHKANKF
jgi:hypothetical protein